MDAENVATVVALVEETLVSDSDGIPGILVNDAPEPLNVVAVKVPFDELNAKLLPVFGGKFPVAAVTNNGKQVVSDDSSAAVTLVAIDALVALVTVTPAICVSNAVPLTVIASASNVPSISALPEISKLAATTSPTVIFGVPLNPAAVPDVF